VKISRFTIGRPVLTLMVTLIVVILGGTAFLRLPVDLMPDISYPMLSITTTYSNTGPEIMEQLITRPIEQALSAVPGVEDLTSTSSEGSSNVRLAFAWGTDLDAATNDVRDRLDRIINRLPTGSDRPRIFKFDYSAFPILFLGVYGSMDPLYLRKIIDDQLSYRLERVPGVASIDVWGGDLREIKVNVFPEALKALNLPIDQVVTRIQAGNVESPVGTVYRDNRQISMRTAGTYSKLDDIRNAVVVVRNGVPVRVSQVAEVEDGLKRNTRIARIDGQPGIRLSVSKQSGKNTVEVAEGVLKEIERINEDMPQLRMVVLSDTSQYIKYSINNVGTSALYGGLIALVVLVFFLRNLASSAVIAVTIPISIIATFALMYFNKFTLNLMSLGGLALGVGMLVDNSIVVLENIYRLREGGSGAVNSAAEGSEEISSAVVASTLTTLVVFLPLIFVEGMTGVMYKQLALIVTFSLLCSLVVALTLVPTLSARLHHPTFEESRQGRGILGGIFHLSGRMLGAVERNYLKILGFSLRRPVALLLGVFAVLGASLLLVPYIGSELMPASDQNQVRITADLEVGTRLEVTDEKFRSLIEPAVMKAVPEASSFITSIGGGFGSTGSQSGSMAINLKPRSQRTRSDEEIARDLRRTLSGIPGVTIRTRTGQGFFMRGFGGSGTEQVSIEVRGYDLKQADVLANLIKEKAEKVQGVSDVRLSRESGVPEEHFVVNREKAADLNVTVSQISTSLKTIFSGTTAGFFRDGGSEYDILVRVKDSENLSYEQIGALTVPSGSGNPIAIGSLVDLNPTTGPMRIERRNQGRIITVSVNVSGRDLGNVAADLRESLRDIPMPRDFSVQLVGDYEEQQKSFREMLLSVALALLLVYMVMASLYESFKDPFIVMFSVPLASVGVLVMLFFTKTTFNIQTGIGALMLGGIVVNNAIVLVDQINLLRRRDGWALREAIMEAGRRRLRPILMTASTTCFAMIPLALGLGEGSEMQAPMARTVIGGLASSTLITLVVIPAVYYIVEHRLNRKDRTAEAVRIAREDDAEEVAEDPETAARMGLERG
jgi:HAE1 family hydrophobic/amphiphilic exporter-1